MSSSDPVATSADANDFPAPSGTKLATNRCIQGPKDCNSDGPQVSEYPILLYDQYAYWPLSYEDNRVSFAIVVTDGQTVNSSIVNTFEAPGSRYIDSIRVHSNNQTVSFIGQGFDAASVSWDDLASEASNSSGGAARSGSGSGSLTSGVIAGIAIAGVGGACIVVFGLAVWLCDVWGIRTNIYAWVKGKRLMPYPNRPYSPAMDPTEQGESDLMRYMVYKKGWTEMEQQQQQQGGSQELHKYGAAPMPPSSSWHHDAENGVESTVMSGHTAVNSVPPASPLLKPAAAAAADGDVDLQRKVGGGVNDGQLPGLKAVSRSMSDGLSPSSPGPGAIPFDVSSDAGRSNITKPMPRIWGR